MAIVNILKEDTGVTIIQDDFEYISPYKENVSSYKNGYNNAIKKF